MLLSLRPYRIHLENKGEKSNLLAVKELINYCIKYNIDYTKINKNQIKLFMQEQGYNSKRKNYNKKIKELKKFYIYLTEKGYCEGRVLLDISSLFVTNVNKIKYKKKWIYIKRLIKDLNKINYSILPFSENKSKSILYFLLFSGLEINEIFSLNRKQLNLDEGYIYLSEKEIRFIPIEICGIIKKYFEEEDERINAFNLTREVLHYFFKKIKQTTIKLQYNLNPSIFKEALIYRLIQKKTDIKILQYITGYSIERLKLYYKKTPLSFKNIKKMYNRNCGINLLLKTTKGK